MVGHPVFSANTTDQLLVTKGDNNAADDVGLYNKPYTWERTHLERDHVVGRVKGYVPARSVVMGGPTNRPTEVANRVVG